MEGKWIEKGEISMVSNSREGPDVGRRRIPFYVVFSVLGPAVHLFGDGTIVVLLPYIALMPTVGCVRYSHGNSVASLSAIYLSVVNHDRSNL
jgi:hypothetical protein